MTPWTRASSTCRKGLEVRPSREGCGQSPRPGEGWSGGGLGSTGHVQSSHSECLDLEGAAPHSGEGWQQAQVGGPSPW